VRRADFFGFGDRGRLKPGLRADINLICANAGVPSIAAVQPVRMLRHGSRPRRASSPRRH
jgi:alpha-D-ribose 1-methylphosphonate 5-triphosphate diphosphatase PhnM